MAWKSQHEGGSKASNEWIEPGQAPTTGHSSCVRFTVCPLTMIIHVQVVRMCENCLIVPPVIFIPDAFPYYSESDYFCKINSHPYNVLNLPC